MKLLYTNCVPIITYACAVRIFSASEMHRCHVAINNAIKKIYSFAIWQSIRDIRTSNGYKSIYEIFAFTRKKFMEAALSSSNQVVAHLVSELPIDLQCRSGIGIWTVCSITKVLMNKTNNNKKDKERATNLAKNLHSGSKHVSFRFYED